jgi:ABC-type lipopolysaccharide export system ATPase subunit
MAPANYNVLHVSRAGADRARITLKGEDVTNLPMARTARARYLPQEPSVFREADAEQNILRSSENEDLASRAVCG